MRNCHGEKVARCGCNPVEGKLESKDSEYVLFYSGIAAAIIDARTVEEALLQ
jgi:hypothetical protein